MKKRKLSIRRLFVLLILIFGLFYLSFSKVQNWQEEKYVSEYETWFGPYVDVTSTPRYAFESENIEKNVVLAFIVASKDDSCIPTWGTAYNLEDANIYLDLDRRIARLRQQGGDIAISFGGLLNEELSNNCKDIDKLYNAYKQVIDRYGIDTIDLDLEGNGLTNTDAMTRRARVIAQLQKDLKSENRNLAVWLTLPVAAFGLTQEGANAVSTFLENNVDLAGVNIMTMNYGQSNENNLSIADASINAIHETRRQLANIYKNAGLYLSQSTIYTKIGVTPMIGQNDLKDEIFTEEDAIKINKFIIENKIGRVSMWSANRDIECGENYVNLSIVSDSCSGISQEKYAFSKALGNGIYGSLRTNSAVETKNEEEIVIDDDPETSPYQIWSETASYLAGTKVVWRGYVYESKWWTQGDSPDNPVLQSWETPWKLVGPVLPGEKKIPQPTLPPGSFPNWDGQVIYDVGDRVLFNGTPYQAKWWTQGDSPAASTENSVVSPWKALTREQISEILESRLP